MPAKFQLLIKWLYGQSGNGKPFEEYLTKLALDYFGSDPTIPLTKRELERLADKLGGLLAELHEWQEQTGYRMILYFPGDKIDDKPRRSKFHLPIAELFARIYREARTTSAFAEKREAKLLRVAERIITEEFGFPARPETGRPGSLPEDVRIKRNISAIETRAISLDRNLTTTQRFKLCASIIRVFAPGLGETERNELGRLLKSLPVTSINAEPVDKSGSFDGNADKEYTLFGKPTIETKGDSGKLARLVGNAEESQGGGLGALSPLIGQTVEEFIAENWPGSKVEYQTGNQPDFGVDPDRADVIPETWPLELDPGDIQAETWADDLPELPDEMTDVWPEAPGLGTLDAESGETETDSPEASPEDVSVSCAQAQDVPPAEDHTVVQTDQGETAPDAPPCDFKLPDSLELREIEGQGQAAIEAIKTAGGDIKQWLLKNDEVAEQIKKGLAEKGTEIERRCSTTLEGFRAELPDLLDDNRSAGLSLIATVTGVQDIDDCEADVASVLLPYSFLGIETSPGSYHCLLAIKDPDFDALVDRLLKRLRARWPKTKANRDNGGSIRWPESLNCKPGRDGYPVRVIWMPSRRVVTAAELEGADLLAPVIEPGKYQPPVRTSPNWPEYDASLRAKPHPSKQDKWDRSAADAAYICKAIRFGQSLSDIAAKLVEVSECARQKGPGYVARTIAKEAAYMSAFVTVRP